jgi:hypothetical protein
MKFFLYSANTVIGCKEKGRKGIVDEGREEQNSSELEYGQVPRDDERLPTSKARLHLAGISLGMIILLHSFAHSEYSKSSAHHHQLKIK